MRAGSKFLSGFVLVAICLFVGSASAYAQRNAHEPKPVPMKLPPAATNLAPWHCTRVTPKTNLPPIHFYNKLNPIWWVQNAMNPPRQNGIGPTTRTGKRNGVSGIRSTILIHC